MENKKIDYKNLKEITVTTQEELDNIPLDFEGQIIINGGTIDNKIKIENDYNLKLKVINNSYVGVYENNFVEAFAYSYVFAYDNSNVESYEDSYIFAHDNSTVESYEDSYVIAWDNSQIEAHNKSRIKAYGNSHIEAYENSYVKAYDNSNIIASDNSSIIAYGNSSVKAYDNSQIIAHGNSQILDMQQGGKIKISGNARIIYMPKNINEFIDFYGIKHTKTKAIFYKAVHKDKNGIYRANYDENFIYEIGKYKTENCDTNIDDDCSFGINIATLNWALDYGENWKNTAILEVETKIFDIIMPKDTYGKVRTSKVKVRREVPLEECGLLEKIY